MGYQKRTAFSLFPSSVQRTFASTTCAHWRALCARLSRPWCMHIHAHSHGIRALAMRMRAWRMRNALASQALVFHGNVRVYARIMDAKDSHIMHANARKLFASLSHPICAHMRVFACDANTCNANALNLEILPIRTHAWDIASDTYQ